MTHFEAENSTFVPSREELKAHAGRWAEWNGREPELVESYGEWFADFHVGQPWRATTPHRLAWKRYQTALEEQTLKNLHPSRSHLGLGL